MGSFVSRISSRLPRPAAPSPSLARAYSTVRSFHPLQTVRREQYSQDLVANGHRYGRYTGQRPVIGNEIETNLALYDVSSSVPLPIIIGPSNNVWIPSLLHNFGGASLVPFISALRGSRFVDRNTLNKREEQVALDALERINCDNPSHLKDGSVLFEKLWSLALNDSFIQGAIDGEKEIHIALSASNVLSIKKAWLYDFANERPTVLGRELLNVASQGYVQVERRFPQLGIVLAPPALPGVRPTSSDLKKRLELVDSVKSADDVLESLSGLFSEKNT